MIFLERVQTRLSFLTPSLWTVIEQEWVFCGRPMQKAVRKSNASLHLEKNVPFMDHQRHWSQLKAGDASSSNEIYETSVSCVFAITLCQTDVWKQSLFRSHWHVPLMFLYRISLFPVVVWEVSLTSSSLLQRLTTLEKKKSVAFLGHTIGVAFIVWM